MKKLLLVLAVASIFIASSAFSATMWKPSESIPPSVVGGFNFDLDYDGTANTITISAAYNLDASGLSTGAWQSSATFNVTAPDANGVVAQTNWLTAGMAFGSTDVVTFNGTAAIGQFVIHVFNFTYDTDGGDPLENRFAGAPYWSPAHINTGIGNGDGWHYEAAPIPIPGAAWLLLSGLVGIIGLRRKS